ncbi:MAG: class II fructose-bisphosphate aldolase [Eubacteriales bacterium]|nr:class II fructose-bisphosphate aldolase [Eubacteriales bacterium]
MYTDFNAMLKEAYSRSSAVGSFNWYNYETLRGIIDASNETGLPVIASFGAKYLKNMSLETAAAMTRSLAEGTRQSICLHLDHCSDKAVIARAVRAGFGSVMYDGSSLPFEENLRNTAEICAIAHACGVSVEAELGSLAAGEHSHEGSADDREVYTDPAMAAEFVSRTGVDALAVSIGTVHGLYKSTPNIRIDILKEINAAVRSPLVLHGGSGTPEEKLLSCIQNGISKINVNTEISEYAVSRSAELLKNERPHFSVLSLKQAEWVKEIVSNYIRLFACL